MAKLGRGNNGGRKRVDAGTEVPEIIIVSDAVEGTFVDVDGESRHAREEEERCSTRARRLEGQKGK